MLHIWQRRLPSVNMKRAEVAIRALEPVWPKWLVQKYGVSAGTAYNWRKGQITAERLDEILIELRSRVGQEEGSPPEWAKSLSDDVAELSSMLRQLTQDPGLLDAVRAEAATGVEQLPPVNAEEPEAEPLDKSE